MKNKILKSGLFTIIWIIYILPVAAGPVDPPGEGDPPYEDPLPVDNWMLMLLIAGISLGVYFIMKYRNKAIKVR